MGEQADARSWGISSVGRAPALQAGGHEFESRILHLAQDATCTLKTAYSKVFYLYLKIQVKTTSKIFLQRTIKNEISCNV